MKHLSVLIVSLATLASRPALAAEYTVPSLGTFLEPARDLVSENIRVLQESALPDGRVLLEVAADLRNVDTGQWADIGANMLSAIEAGLVRTFGVAIAHTFEAGLELAVNGVATSSETIGIIVAAGDLAAARAEILAGTVLYATAETVSGAFVAVASQLPLENIRIVGETVLADGRILIHCAANVRNATTEALRKVTLSFLTAAGTVAYQVANAAIPFSGNLNANAVATPTGALYVSVAPTDLASVRSNILSGALLQTYGTELWVFSLPPAGIDDATAQAWRPPAESGPLGATVLVFTNKTTLLASLQPGDLLVEDPAIHRLAPPVLGNSANPFESVPKVLSNYLPFEVTAVSEVEGEVRVTGRQRTLLDVLRSATFVQDSKEIYATPFRDPYNPTLENTYTDAEEILRAGMARSIEEDDPHDPRLADLKGMTAIPWHFNDTFISEKVKLSGELLFRSSGLRFEVKIRDFQLQRAVTRIDAGAVLNVVVECEAGEDTSDEPEEKKSKELFRIDDIPAITFNVGGVPVSLQPVLSLKAGVEANVPTRLTLPLQSAFTVGMEMGFDRARMDGTNDGFFYEPIQEFIPLRTSDPTVFDDLAATLGVWAEVGLGIEGSIADILNGGPTLGIRLQNDFRLAPLENPWWSVDAGVDLIGRFSVDVLGFTVADADASLHHFDLFHQDAGGPLIGGRLRKAGAGADTDLRPVAGQEARWGRVFQPVDHFGPFEQGFVLSPPEAGGDLIVGGSDASGSVVSRFAPNGDVVWMKYLGLMTGAKQGAALPGGDFVIAGKDGNNLVVCRFDADGNRKWVSSFRPAETFNEVTLMAAEGTNGPGGTPTNLYVGGIVHRPTIPNSDPFLLKLRSDGTLLWAFSYDLPEDDEIHGITLTADGHVLVCGRTDADVPPPPIGTPDSENQFKHMVSAGLLMKIDAQTGAVLWARAFPSRRGLQFNAVVEAPDGSLYAAGQANKIVTQTRPCSLFAKFNSDGSLVDHVVVGEDPDWVDELPNAGTTPWDSVTGLRWIDGSLWACGVTGVGTDQAAWVMSLTDEFGVKFYAIFDGKNDEELFDLADAGNGLAVLGNTRSIHPWGAGKINLPMLLKLPWEGMMRFHEDTQFRTLFLRPHVFHSSATGEFWIISRIEFLGAPPQIFANTFGDVSFTVTPFALTPGGSVPAPTEATNRMVLAVEQLDPALVKDYAAWAAYHQLAGDDSTVTADVDGDGLPNGTEFFSGLNPVVALADPPSSLAIQYDQSADTVTIDFDRATAAASVPYRLQYSTNLRDWLPASGTVEQVIGAEGLTDRLRLRLSTPAPEGAFFRLQINP